MCAVPRLISEAASPDVLSLLGPAGLDEAILGNLGGPTASGESNGNPEEDSAKIAQLLKHGAHCLAAMEAADQQVGGLAGWRECASPSCPALPCMWFVHLYATCHLLSHSALPPHPFASRSTVWRLCCGGHRPDSAGTHGKAPDWRPRRQHLLRRHLCCTHGKPRRGWGAGQGMLVIGMQLCLHLATCDCLCMPPCLHLAARSCPCVPLRICKPASPPTLPAAVPQHGQGRGEGLLGLTAAGCADASRRLVVPGLLAEPAASSHCIEACWVLSCQPCGGLRVLARPSD